MPHQKFVIRRCGDLGFPSPSAPLDLNVCAQVSDSQADAPCFVENRNDLQQRAQGSAFEVEIDATIEIGARVGVEIGEKSEQVRNILGSSGINVVEL